MSTQDFLTTLDKVRNGTDFEPEDLTRLLDATGEDQRALHHAAYEVKARQVGQVVYFRGLIEMSNVCHRNCRYCGIRHDNRKVERFTLTADQIVAAAVLAHSFRYGSIVLQGGERQDPKFTEFITDVLERIHEATGHQLGVTLSLGEQSRATYRSWRQAGAHRYLLRMETSDKQFYRKLHPDHPDWDKRLRCLDHLRQEGFQVGTGVMIGLPGQSVGDLARDLLFFRDQDVDMLGMGPFIPHEATPMAMAVGFDRNHRIQLGLNMIACARLLLPDVNIASTTALQALHDQGREWGLLAGANVIMPNVTDIRFRSSYQLYDGKPNLQENTETNREILQARISELGETVGFGQRGDSPRALARGLVEDSK